MKRLMTTCLVCVLLTAAASQGITAAAPQGMVISFDENGHGDVDGTQLKFGVDTPPVGHDTLYYVLPAIFTYPMVSPGDVKIMEPDAQGNPTDIISDVLRFISLQDLQGYNIESRVYVYSGTGDNDLADTGIPTEFQSNVLTLTEEGTEDGWNGVHYTAEGSVYPGNLMGGPVSYVFTSDVPEPATIALLGLGTLSLLRRKRSA